MSKARTVPGESISSRLAARSGSRARIGPRRSFYQRLGVTDPYGDEPEVEEIARSGMYSFLSAANYYRELRSQRLRMMWRLGAIRHRSVAGERLRAAGPSFAASRTLAGAALPSISDFVLIDPDARPEGEEELEAPVRRRRSETPRRRRKAATRAVERSVGRPDAELTRALAQIESLVRGRSKDAVHAVQRDLPSIDANQRPAVIRELVRTVERDVVRETAARPAAIERIVERVHAPTLSAPAKAQRPVSVAAQRGRSVDAPLPGRSLTAPLFEGPSGLEPVLRTSPSVRAAIAVERAGRRPEAIERLAAATRSRAASRALPAPERVELTHAPTETAEEAVAAPVRRRAPEAPRRRVRGRGIVPEALVALPDVPTARMARVAATQPLAARIYPEVVEAARGPRAIAPRIEAPQGALPRALMRARVGQIAEGERAPLATAATSWLSEAEHPQRARRRVERSVPTTARSLAVAGELPLLEHGPTDAPVDTPQPSRARAVQTRPARVIRREEPAEAPASAVRRSSTASEARPTLRAITRSQRDESRLAPSPVARRRVERALPITAPVLLDPSEPEQAPMAVPVRRRTAPAAAAAPAIATRNAPSELRPAARVGRRLDRAQPDSIATAPILDRIPVDDSADTRTQRRPVRPVAVDLVALSPSPVAEEVTEASARRRSPAPRAAAPVPGSRSRRPSAADAIGAHTPATRRAMHRAVEAQAVSPARRPLTASPTSFVNPLLSQRALEADDHAAVDESASSRSEQAVTRAASRSVRTARVDGQDRVRLVPSVTDYLDVAAGAEDLVASPLHRVRRNRLFSPDAQLVQPGRTEAPTRSEAALARSVPTARVAERARPRRLAIDLNEARDVAVRPPARRVQAAPVSELLGLARRLSTPDGVTSDAPAARAAARSEAGQVPGTPAERPVVDELAAASVTRRRPRSVIAMQELAVAQPLLADEPETAPAIATRRRDLPPITESLRQVAGSFRAAERDAVHVVSTSAARRAVEPRGARAPSLEAILERDDSGRIIQVRARRLTGPNAGETVILDPGALGLPTVEGPGSARPVARAAERAEQAAGVGTEARPRTRTAPAPSVLARTPAEWAEERADAAAPVPRAARGERRVSSPVRRAGQRWTRPIPEGPVLEPRERAFEPTAAHRLTAPMARALDFEAPAPVRGMPRVRGPRPLAPERSLVGGPEAAIEEGAERPTRPTRRRAHTANTWTDLNPRDREGGEVPSWVRRAVEPAKADRAERESPGSRIRAGGGLLTALSRASDPEEVVRVIMQRGHQASALARELPGEAGALLQTIAATPASALDEPTVVPARGNRGDTIPSQASRRARTAWLESGPEPSRTWRTRGGSGATSEAGEGVGASSIMKLASKLKKLIHLAEHARRDEARSAVRMSEDTGESRQDVGAGKAGGQALEEDNMHIERLREEVMREVQHMLEMNKMRSIGDGDGQW